MNSESIRVIYCSASFLYFHFYICDAFRNLNSHTHKTSPPVRWRRILTNSTLSVFIHLLCSPPHICSHTMRSLGCQHTDVVFNIKHTVADGISNGNANGPFRNDFTSPVYLLCIIFLEVSTIFLFNFKNGNRKKDEDENV